MPRYEVSRPGDHEPIVGPHDVALRPIAEDDLSDLWRWLHDAEVVQWWDEPSESLEECRSEYLEPDESPTWRFIIEWRGRSVGMIQYGHAYADSHYSYSANIDILIGEPDARDRGVGTEAIRTMLRYLFEVKRLHRVTIDPQTTNTRAIRAYEKAGFRRDGILRHNDVIRGEYVDTQYLTMLEDEWPAARAHWLDARR